MKSTVVCIMCYDHMIRLAIPFLKTEESSRNKIVVNLSDHFIDLKPA